jgi:hypothetical protein
MNQKQAKNKRFSGYFMTIIGFILILINAVNYIFGWEFKSTPLVILGLIFVVIGLKIAKENK